MAYGAWVVGAGSRVPSLAPHACSFLVSAPRVLLVGAGAAAVLFLDVQEIFFGITPTKVGPAPLPLSLPPSLAAAMREARRAFRGCVSRCGRGSVSYTHLTLPTICSV